MKSRNQVASFAVWVRATYSASVDIQHPLKLGWYDHLAKNQLRKPLRKTRDRFCFLLLLGLGVVRLISLSEVDRL